MSHDPTVAVDLDGVLAEYDGWEGLEKIGGPVDGARNFLLSLREEGIEVVIHTTRANPDPFNEGINRHAGKNAGDIIRSWLEKHDMHYDRVFTGEGKPIATAYVDDRAITCRPHASSMPEMEFEAAFLHIKDTIAGE